MKMLVIDPGLSGRRGHNGALAAEFDQEFRDLGTARWTFAAAACTVPGHFAHFSATTAVLPVFRIDGYARMQSSDVLDDARLQTLVKVAAEDLARLPLEQFDALLMPTCYPLHLIALSQLAPRLARKRVMIGLLMPATFWANEAGAAFRLGERMGAALLTLQSACDVLAYSEVGSYCFGDATVETATLLPPVSAVSMRQLEGLTHRDRPGAQRPVTLGFFGSPFTSKGVVVAAEAARGLDPARTMIRFRLPPGHQPMCDQLRALSPAIDATSSELSNTRYFEEMDDVDAVLAFYDPAEYGTKMSGIVPEAICLGKPVVVSDGCGALCRFLDRYAPGAFVTGTYGPGDLAAVLRLPAPVWASLGAKARASADVVRTLKSMRRYLTVGGLGELYWLDRRAMEGPGVPNPPAFSQVIGNTALKYST